MKIAQNIVKSMFLEVKKTKLQIYGPFVQSIELPLNHTRIINASFFASCDCLNSHLTFL